MATNSEEEKQHSWLPGTTATRYTESHMSFIYSKLQLWKEVLP